MSERVELGCPGHLCVARSCVWHRHTQIVGRRSYRVSTLGDYYNDDERIPIGSGEDDWYETMVFELITGMIAQDSDGCGCFAVESWAELECERYATAGAAQAGHEALVAKYLQLSEKEECYVH